MSVSVFDKVGMVPAKAAAAAGAIVALQGVSDTRATFGLLQNFSIESKVLAQIKRTLRQVPVIFPMGDDLSEISLGFMAPMSAPCDGVPLSDLEKAITAYAKHRVTPESVNALTVSVGNVGYRCLMLGMRADGALQGSLPIVSVSLRLVGVKG